MVGKRTTRAAGNVRKARQKQVDEQHADLAQAVAEEVGVEPAAAAAAQDAQYLWVIAEMRTGDFAQVRLTCLGTFKPLWKRIHEVAQHQARKAAQLVAASLALPVVPVVAAAPVDEQTARLVNELRVNGGLALFTDSERKLLHGL